MKNPKIMITTIDNPFNPLIDFDDWFYYDMEKGYNTCGKLARLTNNSSSLSSQEEIEDIERAIDRLIEIDPLNMYVKVTDSATIS